MKHIERLTLALAALLAVTPLVSAQEAVKYVHLDAIGNVRAVSDQANAVVERHDYLPFGEEWCPGPPAGVCGSVPPGQSRRFTSKERDQETGLDYFGARYYGSRIARFTTVDPMMNIQKNLLDPQGWNRYGYGRNNPLSRIDPDGRDDRFTMMMEHKAEIARLGGVAPMTPEQQEGDRMIAGTILTGLGAVTLGGPLVRVGGALLTEALILGSNPAVQQGAGEILEAVAGGPPISPSSAASAANALRLSKQLASEAQVAQLLAGGGEAIAGAGHRTPIRDVPRLVATYGGEASDWSKVRSENFKAADGVSFETHAYRNGQTGQTVELKTKFQ